MSREIKFRSWDKANTQEMFRTVLAIDWYNDEIKIEHNSGMIEDEKLSDFVLMQYTCLKDKNGIEVYVNDIVEDEYGRRYEVVFEGDCLRCNGVRKKKGGHKPKNRWFGKDLKIIGNRYENPELLKER